MQAFKRSQLRRRLAKLVPSVPVVRLHAATLIMLCTTGFFGAIALSWFLGEANISGFFAQLHFWQVNPPVWLEVPQFSSDYYLLVPTLVLFAIAQGVMKLSPQPKNWSRSLVVGILLALTVRYLLWRSFSTLNLVDPLNGIFSLGIFLIEILVILSNSLQFYLILKAKPRHREADRMSVAVVEGKYAPSVDILIPTYNEPEFILRRTIIGCQALDYANKKIYLLDDKRREGMRFLAKELGCEYITRPDNRYAKAGNLNNAISRTSGELIVVFDADFVPTKNFLERTIGFFQDRQTALVQTYQSFYNPDPVARNLGLENEIVHEEEVCQRHYQVLRDGIETVVCSGTSFVVRRKALEEVGGFVTESLSEDYFTGIRLSACGYRTIYLGESLSAGLSAENMAGHILQRMRWARGTLQAFFIQANPLTIPGISWLQRLAHLEGILQWIIRVFRLVFLLMPIAYLFLGVVPYQMTVEESLYFFIPFYVLQISTLLWLNNRSRSALLSDIYAVSQCFPVSLAVIQTLLSPFSKGFKVTPKGVSQDRFIFNWTLALPLIVTFMLTLVSFGYSVSLTLKNLAESTMLLDGELLGGMLLSWFWGAYNLLVVGVALVVMLDAPNPDYEWYPLRRSVQLSDASQTVWGVTQRISEVGAEIQLRQNVHLNTSVVLEIEGITLQGRITRTNAIAKLPTVQILFEQVSLAQYRCLVEMLYCQPGQWKPRQTPGELRSLWLLLKVFLRPLALLSPKIKKALSR